MLPSPHSVFMTAVWTTEPSTLSLHDALPIFVGRGADRVAVGVERGLVPAAPRVGVAERARDGDRKSTRLNSSHLGISYAVFCVKKKTNALLAAATRAVLRSQQPAQAQTEKRC